MGRCGFSPEGEVEALIASIRLLRRWFLVFFSPPGFVGRRVLTSPSAFIFSLPDALRSYHEWVAFSCLLVLPCIEKPLSSFLEFFRLSVARFWSF